MASANSLLAEDPVVKEIVRRLVESIQPDKIILFGSRARGDAHPGSDYDVMIIKPTTDQTVKRFRPARKALGAISAPIDLLWYTPEEFSYRSRWRNHVTARALREGMVVYDRALV